MWLAEKCQTLYRLASKLSQPASYGMHARKSGGLLDGIGKLLALLLHSRKF